MARDPGKNHDERQTLLTSALVASATTLLPGDAFAQLFASRTATQESLFDTLPRPKPGAWTRLILGAGVEYKKTDRAWRRI